MAASDFWKDRQAEFEKYATQYPTLAADWGATHRIWTLSIPGLTRETIRGSVPDPFNVPRECKALFDAIARKALVGLPGQGAPGDAEPSQLWLDVMREREWGFQHTGSPIACTEQEWGAGVKDGKPLAQVRREQGYTTGDEWKKLYRRTKNGKLRRLSSRELKGKSSNALEKYYQWLGNGTIERVFEASAHCCECLAASAFELEASGTLPPRLTDDQNAPSIRTEGMDYPNEFSREARNAVEAEIILARRELGEARRTTSVPMSHYATRPSDEFEQAFLASIIRVFLIFALNAVDLCRAGDWSLDRVDRESREFLRRLTIQWRYDEGRDRVGNQVQEVAGNWGGGLLRWVEEKFESRPEWAQYEDLRLTAAGRAVTSSTSPQTAETMIGSGNDSAHATPPAQTISPGYVPSRRSVAAPSLDLQRSFPSSLYSITGGPSDPKQRTDLYEEIGWLARKIQALEGPPILSPSGALDRLLTARVRTPIFFDV